MATASTATGKSLTVTPVEWLESGDLRTSASPYGRVRYGGFTVFAHLKYDMCECKSDLHWEAPDPMRSLAGYPDTVKFTFYDPYEVAVKRGSPA
jgi:hypothetical protein